MTDEEIVRYILIGIPVCEDCRIAMEQDYETDLYICPNCDRQVVDPEEYIDNSSFSKLIDIIHFENPKEPYEEGCVSCGNSVYPNCKTSCGLFDD